RMRVREVLITLAASGVLEDAAADREELGTGESAAPEGQLRFFSRYVDLTRANDSRIGYQRALRMAHVVVVSTGLFGAAVERNLREMGVGRISILGLDDASA